MSNKRSFEQAFERKPLKRVDRDTFYVEHTVYKVLRNAARYNIVTEGNDKFTYGESVIVNTAMCATMFENEIYTNKTELIKLFSAISVHDVWHATFLKQDKEKEWADQLAASLQSMSQTEAAAYIKKEHTAFGKTLREITGKKLSPTSDNNYYLVRDLNIYFDEMATNGIENAKKNSVRNLDVNTIQTLTFNNTKYILSKSKVSN